MEIRVRIPVQVVATKQTLEINKQSLLDRLLVFIDKLENQKFLDEDIYKEILDFGVNKEEFDKMIKEVGIYSSYDENPNDIGFPYESWIDKLVTIYETAEQTRSRVSSTALKSMKL